MAADPIRGLLFIPLMIAFLVAYIAFMRFCLRRHLKSMMAIFAGESLLWGIFILGATFTDNRMDTWSFVERIVLACKLMLVAFVGLMFLYRLYMTFKPKRPIDDSQ